MKSVRKLTRCAFLTAAALVVFVIESQIPPLTASPGIKPGLSNIFTLFALQVLGPGWAFALFLMRVTLGSVITGQTMAFIYSMAGGLLAFAVMAALRKLPEDRLWVSGVLAAMAHNLGQIAAAVAVTGTKEILYYLPVLLLSGIIAGSFTGICAQLVLRRLRNHRWFH